jgi:CHASE2 domain-containing sensor protein
MTTVQPAHVSLRSRLTQPAIGAIVGLIVAALVLILWALNWFVGLRLGMTNAYFVPQTTSGHIVMVAIDDDSLAKYGALLGWSRQRYAELLNVFIEGDARVVAFDLLMSEPNSGDPRFVQALEAAKAAGVRTILPTVGVNRIASSGGVVQFENELRPLPQLESAAAYLAYVNAFPDADGVIRRSLSFGQQGESRRIAFSLAAYLSYYNVSPALAPQVIQIEGETIQFPTGVTLQMGQDGLWQQNYFGAATDLGGGTFPLVSVRDVLNGTVAPSTFQDKIVLVGLVGATGAVDRYPTPISTPDLMSGLEIQANAIETLLQNRPLHPQSRWGQALAIVLCGVIGGVLFVSLRWYWALISGGLVLVGFLAYASSLFEAQLTVVNLLHPILTLGLTVLR